MADYYSVSIVNNTKIIDDADIYIIGKGQDPATYSYKEGVQQPVEIDGIEYDTVESFPSFDPSTGQGSFTRIDKAGDQADFAKTYSIRLSELKGKTLKLPMTNGGRYYISYGYPVVLERTTAYEDGKPIGLTIGEPDPTDMSNTNYTTIYDKVEFTYDKSGLYMDTTGVDFVGIPMTTSAVLKQFGKRMTYGVITSRKEFLKGIDDSFGSNETWKVLKQEFKGIVLRVMAPNKATTTFPADYLDKYVDAVWKYYANTGSKTLRIDCSEIGSEGNYTGSVDPAVDQWIFKSDSTSSPPVRVDRPTSNQVFGCADGPFAAPNGTVRSVIVRELGAGLTTGLLPTTSTEPLNTNWFEAQKQYSTNPLAPTLSGGPAYNLYAKAVHLSAPEFYAFAFDDAAGKDGTVRAFDPLNEPTTLTLGDMTGSPIPSKTDTTKYTLKVHAASGCTAKYPATNTEVNVASGQTVEFKDQTSPFSIAYNNSTGWVTYTVVADPPGKTPSGAGKVTVDGTTVEFVGGGAPTTDAVATPTATHLYNVTLVAGGTMSGVFGGTSFKAGTKVFSAKVDNTDGTKLSFQYGADADDLTTYTVNIETSGSISPSIPGKLVIAQAAGSPADVTISLWG